MKKEDIKQVQNVARKSWNFTYVDIIPDNIQDSFLKSAYSDEMMGIRLNQTLILVAEIDNKVVGFANFTPVNDKGESELSAIYLYPDCHGKGIGTALLEEGIKELENVKEVYIDVEKENSIGLTFYEAKGFKKIKEYDDNFDGYILKTV